METALKDASARPLRRAEFDWVIVQPLKEWSIEDFAILRPGGVSDSARAIELTNRIPLRAKTLLGLQMTWTRDGSHPRASQSNDRRDTNFSSDGRSGVSKVKGPKTSSVIR